MPANVAGAVKTLRTLYDRSFGGKERGRFVLTREQVGQILGVKKLHEVTLSELQTDALNEADLVVSELSDQLYGIIDATVAARWRRLPKKNLSDVLGEAGSRTGSDAGSDAETLDESEDHPSVRIIRITP